MLVKRIQLGLIHAAVAMTLVPINGTLNRVMIKELALAATLVAALASLPYLFSPIQVAIGAFADRHPLFGLRRTPYIIIGLLMCVAGVSLAPYAAYWMAEHFWTGILLALLAFGAWGMGFNFASVSYLSLATEISGEKGRSRTIAVMFFIMISSIIVTSIGLSRLLETYTPETLIGAFRTVALLALVLGLLGLVGLENRSESSSTTSSEERYPLAVLVRGVMDNPYARRFFVYLILMLAAILGQDVLLEPFAAEAFAMPVTATTRITSIWGVCVLLFLAVAGLLEGRLPKLSVVKIGGIGAVGAFLLLALSGAMHSIGLFYLGVVLLGLSTGLATVSNLSLMLDMTTPANVGLFMGAWGMANAMARLTGSLVGGLLRDALTQLTANPVVGYVGVFIVEAGMLLASLVLLRGISVAAFQQKARLASLIERAAAASD